MAIQVSIDTARFAEQLDIIAKHATACAAELRDVPATEQLSDPASTEQTTP